MWRLHSALHPDITRLTVGRTGPAMAQLRGLGGIGKTLLAEEYALRFGAAYPGGIFWLHAYGSHEDQRPATFEELAADHDRQIRAIAARLGLPVADLNPDEVLGALAAKLAESGQPCLWVVDDLPDGLQASQVQALLAPHPVARTLLTTRSRRYDQLAEAVDLDVLPPEDALTLLTRHRPARSDQERTDAADLVAELGYHALAIDVAGAALRVQTGLVSFAEFRTALQDPSQDELELAGQLATALPGGHQTSIAVTLQRSIRRLDAPASDLLRLAALVAAAPLPLGLIAAVLQRADGLDAQAARRLAARGVTQAETLSLASPTGLGADPDVAGEPTVEGGWVVHALVARTARFTDLQQQRTAALRAAAVAVLTQALQAIVDPRAHIGLRQVVPHARELARHLDTAAEADLLGWVGRYDYERGHYRQAEQANRQVLEVRRRLLGPEHPDILAAMNNLAETLRPLGDAAVARDLLHQVVEVSRRLLGPEHPNTLSSMNNLALSLHALGDFAGARELLSQVAEANRRLQGPEHPTTLSSMNNLATTLVALGNFAGARDLLSQVLESTQRLLGPEHPDTLQSKNNLAETLAALGDAASAAKLHRQVLDARQQVLGPEHPDTLQSKNNLAETLAALGDMAGAADLRRQVVDATRRLLGPKHPDTLTSMNNLAVALFQQGDAVGAAQLHRQVHHARQQVLGPEHPHTLQSMDNLGGALAALGDLTSAASLQRQALDGRWRLLGPDHPDTLSSMNHLAEMLVVQGDLTSARDLVQQAAHGYQKLLGPQHPTTRTVTDNLALVQRLLGESTP